MSNEELIRGWIVVGDQGRDLLERLRNIIDEAVERWKEEHVHEYQGVTTVGVDFGLPEGVTAVFVSDVGGVRQIVGAGRSESA